MRSWRSETRAYLLGSALLLCAPQLSPQADASALRQPSGARYLHSTSMHAGRYAGYVMARARYANYRSYAISCVPYAREVSGIDVPGNAWQWWSNAAGVYARGERPEAGSVLAFRANGRMRLGHVAVVAQVINAREVTVDHANWPGGGSGGVSHDAVVVDVSEANDWSAVRVQLPNRAEFGSVYPTYGFIYNRPDRGEVMARVTRAAPIPLINQAPSDLRPVAERPWQTVEEVAQSPVTRGQRLDLTVTAASVQ